MYYDEKKKNRLNALILEIHSILMICRINDSILGILHALLLHICKKESIFQY